ncbi:MAG: hypothetical protein IPP87_22650 [Ideonella sp.]|nr:hypothetical protein [Ideonella sp.]
MDAIELVLCSLNVQTPTVTTASGPRHLRRQQAGDGGGAREKLGMLKGRFAT